MVPYNKFTLDRFSDRLINGQWTMSIFESLAFYWSRHHTDDRDRQFHY
ncbi:MAG: hypothetical protein AAF383_00340 [Cyanobacteria bacterium P01_A01_bin.83]